MIRKDSKGRFVVIHTGCLVKDCNGEHVALGYCQKHYMRFKKYNNPNIKHKGGRNPGFIGLNKGKNNGNWGGGISEYPNHYELKKIRKIIIKENPICSICKINKSTVTHHLDKSKNNHSPKNLIAVCQKCHVNKYHKDTIGKKRVKKVRTKKNNNEKAIAKAPSKVYDKERCKADRLAEIEGYKPKKDNKKNYK